MGKRIGVYFKELRECRGLKLEVAAINIGISKSYLSQIENGLREPPKPKYFNKIAKVYRVSIDEITEAIKRELDGKMVSTKTSADRQAALLTLYDMLSLRNKDLVMDFLIFLLDRQDKEKRNRRR